MNRRSSDRVCGLGRRPHLYWNRGERSFALELEPVELVETRRELLREAQLWLTEWEHRRDDEARGRLLQCLEVLAWLANRPR